MVLRVIVRFFGLPTSKIPSQNSQVVEVFVKGSQTHKPRLFKGIDPLAGANQTKNGSNSKISMMTGAPEIGNNSSATFH